ncbi:MAG TPA: hypothetical protein VHB21_27130, partial [Minicystis sp.]|nr:hypothetical protein [Minicystis sp.]
MPPARDPRPPLAKVRALPAVRARVVSLVAALEGRAREIFERADVVSEGEARVEGARRVYYGSTHVLIAPRSAGGALD